MTFIMIQYIDKFIRSTYTAVAADTADFRSGTPLASHAK